MNTDSIETIPQSWDDERDGVFFRLTADVFTPGFCSGATVLLASYDTDDVVADLACPPGIDSARVLSMTAREPQPAVQTPVQRGS